MLTAISCPVSLADFSRTLKTGCSRSASWISTLHVQPVCLSSSRLSHDTEEEKKIKQTLETNDTIMTAINKFSVDAMKIFYDYRVFENFLNFLKSFMTPDEHSESTILTTLIDVSKENDHFLEAAGNVGKQAA